jgi:hypothetical protein
MSIPNNAFQKCLVILLVKLAFSSPWKLILTMFSQS